jgi:hypothetical protein
METIAAMMEVFWLINVNMKRGTVFKMISSFRYVAYCRLEAVGAMERTHFAAMLGALGAGAECSMLYA